MKKRAAKKNIKSLFVPTYSAVFELDADGYYNVSFPSFPGCVTFGRTFEEAKKMAEEVLGLWIEELEDQGKSFPKYTTPIVTEIRPRAFA
jgi:predicted RNase H-like HicB family nuclease